MKTPKTLDNKNGNVVYKELNEYLNHNSKVSVISKSFSIYAYYKLQDKLNDIDSMRFIFTKPSFLNNQNNIETREYEINTLEEDIFGTEYELRLKNEMTQSAITKSCADWIKEKVEIKSYIEDNTAQRMINIDNNDENNNLNIMGSFDFTTEGLGYSSSNRDENNICFYDKNMFNQQINVFNQIWENPSKVIDIKDKFLKRLQMMYIENSPEFLYYVSMYNLFNDSIRNMDADTLPNENNGFKNSQIWNKLFKFQQDAVIGIINKIETYNGCILADSVGLGKTFTALGVIKYYELSNRRKILVLVPKKLRDNWTIYTKNDKRNIFAEDSFNFDVLNHTDLSRDGGYSGDIDLKTVNWGNYDLVVIDESHNFRNNPPVKDRVTRYQKLMNEIIKSGIKTKVLMLSATPVNNRMADIKNQIAFINAGDDNALENVGIKSIETTLKNAQTIFKQWSNLPAEERTTNKFINMINLDYFKLLDTLTIARSRKHILKYYDNTEIGDFPTKLAPINIRSDIDKENEFPSIKEIDKIIYNLNMSAYTPVKYLLPNKIDKYTDILTQQVKGGASSFKQSDRDINVTFLIRTNILKRLESSIHSYILTLENILFRIRTCLEMIETNDSKITDDLGAEIINTDEEEEYDKYVFGQEKEIYLSDMDTVKWKEDLEIDKEKLEKLLEQAKKVTPDRDNKLEDLREEITKKINNPINNKNKKIIVFTTFADTAQYLYGQLSEWLLQEFGLYSCLVTGGNNNKTNLKGISNSDLNEILLNFSPKSKERDKLNPDQKEEIDVLFSTDCISEGQNLQDCDYLINYDIHWNPVRIIQRFGRIDRIGSNNNQIQLVNFWPNIELDEYIDLKERVENRMVLVDVSSTGDENIIKKEDKKQELEYRRKQLEQLKDQVIELEDINGGISITDLTFNDFKIDLIEFKKTHEKELHDSPHGIYSIVEIPNELREELEEGVIFLLKETKSHIKENPLNPYFLVYITENKIVKMNYVNSKKIMDYYKKLCYGNKDVFEDLVKEFNKQTKNGIKMDNYSELLRIAIENTQGKHEEIRSRSFFEDGPTIPSNKDIQGLDNFELITFLIMK